ncbi:MAG TPA: hypothetical protein PK926_09860 [Spirochaetota bacterium]|nr:hypothetical protein [Spirochaetota bacterium]HPI88833.1 hypothetical protein [Spirochaetota bacterium]HPR47679.1 hypothetical protein [Spirochaetota bacterium]
MRFFQRGCFIALAVVSLITSCTIFEPTTPQLIDLLPRETDTPGWLVRNRELLLPEQMTDDNRIYALFNAEKCARAFFYSLADERLTLMVEIIKFPTPFHCFGLFSFERGFDTPFIESAEDSYLTQKGMFVWKGDYYVKVTSTENTLPTKEFRVFGSIASGNISSLASRVKLPPHVYTFSDNYSTKDLVYYIQGHRLLPGSEKVFVRKKVIFDEQRYVFFVRYDSSLAATEGYVKILNSASPGFIMAKEGDLQMNFRKGDGKRYVFLSIHREYLFGVLNAEDTANGQRIMVKLDKELADYYK